MVDFNKLAIRGREWREVRNEIGCKCTSWSGITCDLAPDRLDANDDLLDLRLPLPLEGAPSALRAPGKDQRT